MNTHEIHVLPLLGRPLEHAPQGGEGESDGVAKIRCDITASGFLLGTENWILEPLIQGIVAGSLLPQQLPVFLYGDSGTGKTHLLKSMAKIRRKNSQPSSEGSRRSYYLSANDFSRQYAEAVANRSVDDFRQRYGKAELLLIDDIDQMESKPAVLQELRQLLDAAAADFPPCVHTLVFSAKALPEKGDDWTARLIGGTAVPIFPPGTAVRRQFLRDLANSLRIPITEHLLKEAAQNITGTIPQIYAEVVRRYAAYQQKKAPFSADFWQFSPQKRPQNGQTANVTRSCAEIAEKTAAHFALNVSDLIGHSRCKTVVFARSIAVYLIKRQNRHTFREIGSAFGSRDPSTIRHMYEKVEAEIQTDSVLRDHVFRLSHQ